MAGALVATAVLIAALSFRSSAVDYSPLFSSMAPEDAGELVALLKEKGVSYKLSNGGTTVEVPSAKMHELRIELAATGYPRGGGVGNEIFDKQAFGTTTFVEQQNARRALEGELTRSIVAISAVKSVRVHLAMGKRSVFRESEKPAKASVALRLKLGRKLSADEVAGIVNLVANSVNGLEPSKVVVIDEHSRILSINDEEGGNGRVSDVQRKIEASLEERIHRMLERVVGVGNSSVVVTADMDFSRIDKTEEMFDKDNIAIRSETRNLTRDKKPETVGGIAGARANLDGSGSALSAETGDETSLSESRNFDVPRVLKHTIGPASSIQRLHVAVLVNHKRVEKKPSEEASDAKEKAAADPKADPKSAEAEEKKTGEKEGEETEEEGEKEPEFEMVALTEKDLEVIRAIVKQAAGLNDERGDSLVVHNVLFEKNIELAPEEPMVLASPFISQKMYFAACGVAGLLLMALTVMMVKRKSATSTYTKAQLMALPASLAEVERTLDGHAPAQLPGSTDPKQLEESQNGNIYDRVVGTVRSDAGHAARVISALLDEGAKGNT